MKALAEARAPLMLGAVQRVGGPSRDSSGFGAIEEGLISRETGPQASSPFLTPTAVSLQRWGRRVRPRLV